MLLLLLPNTTGCDGSDLFMPWLLWMLGAFLTGLVIGWLLKHLLGGSKKEEIDTSHYTAKIKGLETELAACRKEKTGLSSELAAAATLAATTKVDDSVKDDYTKIEGIGPKIKELLNADGLWSFKQLSEASIERLQKILDNAGPRYRVHNPKTWAEQAKMAHEGRWEELKKWQDELDGGL